MPNHLDLVGPDDAVSRVNLTSRMLVNSATAARELALAGAGAIEVLEFFVRDQLTSGELVRLLPNWRLQPAGVYAVWPGNVARGALAQRFVEFLQQRLSQATHRKVLPPELLALRH